MAHALTDSHYAQLTAEQRLIADRLARTPPGRTLSWEQLAPGSDGYRAGAALRRLHREGFIVRSGRPTGPKRWEASWAWRALALRRIGQTPDGAARPALPAPPSLTDPDRFEQLASFRALWELLTFFQGRRWGVCIGAGHEHSVATYGRAIQLYEDRLTEPLVQIPDQCWVVELDNSSFLYFSRRAYQGAAFDRCFQSVRIVQHGRTDIEIEFVPDGIDE